LSNPARSGRKYEHLRPVVFVLLFLGVPMALLTRDLFRQIAPHKDSTTHSAQRSQGRPVPTRVPAQTEQWTALDDVQLRRLLQHPPEPGEGSLTRTE